MNKKWLIAAVPGFVALFLIAFVGTLFIVKLLWAWTIPDLFPGAVVQGLVARELSWYTALKIALCIAVLSRLIPVKQADRS